MEDLGSGLNYKRKNFSRLMSQVEHGEVSEIVIAHKDRLVSFGFRWFEKFASGHGCEVVVMDAEPLSPEEHSRIRLINFRELLNARSRRPLLLRFRWCG